MKQLRSRKPNRLQNYDYSQNGAYFVTICAKDRLNLFAEIPVVGAVVNRPSQINRPPCTTNHPPHVKLTEIGIIIENEIIAMQNIRKNVIVPHYVIMPNHIHMIIVINAEHGGRLTTAPTVSEIIRLWKRAISIEIGCSVWQKSFHDRIIRNSGEYTKIAQYIENNPYLWTDDCFYQQ